MTIEELYKLRQKVIENKESFSKLNKKYNELLSKKHKKSLNEKKLTDEEIIKNYSYYLYCIRFIIIMLIRVLLSIPADVILLLVFINIFWKVFDETLLLPKLIEKQKKNQ